MGVAVSGSVWYNTHMANQLYTDRSHRSVTETRPSTAAARTTRTSNRSAASQQTRPTGSTGAGGSHKPRRSSKKKKQQRRFLFAVLFLAFAIILLATAIILAIRVTRPAQQPEADPNASALATPAAVSAAPATLGTPVPVTDDTVIAGDVTVNGVRVVGKRVADARTAVESALQQQMSGLAIKVIYGELAMTLTADKIGMYYSPDALETALEQAANERDTAELFVPLSYDEMMLKSSLTELNEQLPNHANNATAEILWKENKIKSSGETYLQPYFKFNEGTNGMAVDSESVLHEVEDALSKGDYNAEIRPEVTVSEPAITVATLQEQYALRGSFVTTYRFRGTSSMDETSVLNCESRDINISKAVSLMRVIELKPGESFSYNRATGSRTEKNGWALANAIYQGSHRPEPGGGVCQLSTTMYNALLLANVKITSRRAHSMPVDYVPDGWDATVDDGHIDFKFQNNTDGKLYVFCYITKNSGSSRKKDIHVEVYGKAIPSGTEYRKRTELVEILPITEETIKDKTMFVGDKPVVDREGKEGKVVNTFIDRYVDGKLDKTVYSVTTTYEAITKQIRVGTKADPTATPTAKPTATPEPEEIIEE